MMFLTACPRNVPLTLMYFVGLVLLHACIVDALTLLYSFLKIDENVEKVFKAATAVSGSILKKKVPNEKVVLLETENLEASLQRSDRDRMNGSSVQFSAESDAKIAFPDAFDLGNDLEIVDTVVNIHISYFI